MKTSAILDAATEFATAFDASKDIELWKKLFDEERLEVREAFQNLLKETCDIIYIMGCLIRLDIEQGRLKEANSRTELMIDYIEVMEEIFKPGMLDEAFKRVHASNMSKLGEDGKPVRREDGKILKGPNYKPPVLTDLL